MVNRNFSLTGLCWHLLVAIPICIGFFVDFPSAAYAQCTNGVDPIVDAILGQSANFLSPLPPVSDHYTRKILMRAEAGIREAEKLEHTFAEHARDGVIRDAFSTYANPKIMDTDARIVRQERNLHEVTFCLHVDLFLIETMMQKVQCRIQYAYEEQKIATILELQSLMKFLSDRYDALLKGAHDNMYEDKDWWFKQRFDAEEYESWCCRSAAASGEACEPFWNWEHSSDCQGNSFGSLAECVDGSGCEKWEMCPFHSDYLPPTVFVLETPYEEHGKKKVQSEVVEYGCDLYALGRYASILGGSTDNDVKNFTKLDEVWEAEYKNMHRAMEKRDALVSKAGSIKDHTINIREWLGRQCSRRLLYFGTVSMPASQSEAAARHRIRIGCNDEDGNAIIPLPALPPEPEKEGDADEYDPHLNYGPPNWPIGLIRWELRGPFSLEKNEPRLVRNYDALRLSWGEQRPLGVKWTVEDPGGEWVNLLFNPLKHYVTDLYFYNWDRHQEQMEGAMAPKASDAPAQIVRELQPVRTAVGNLARTANTLDGVRGFARSFAYFLRRSCIYRPCNDRLDQILKVVFSDDCFPYTDGIYLNDPKIIDACRSAVRKLR